MKRVLARELIQALPVLGDAKLLGHDRGDRCAVGLAGPGERRDGGVVSRRVALQEYRDRQEGHHQTRGEDQQAPVAHVAIEVSEELRWADVLHGAAVVVVEESVAVVLVLEVVDVLEAESVGVASAGPVGVAPAVRPWSAGVR
jgi:hypothetical protein